MRLTATGVLNRGQPGTRRANSTFPSIAILPDKSLLASYRVGSTKDSDDEAIELRRSADGGRTWSEPVAPFSSSVEGRRGSLKLVYVTPLSGQHLLAAGMWVDREAYPGCPLFNSRTEGCLPMQILLSDSFDLGRTWSDWRELPLPYELGPPSLTNPILRLPSGDLAVSIETNKSYLDDSTWYQRVVYAWSNDLGRTWGPPSTVSQDPTARIFNWDQRAGVAPDWRLVSFSWTYDRQTNRYLNVHRRVSRDEGHTWSEPEDLGFTDQPSHPAILSDGRIVVAWVDRFQSRSIRARSAAAIDAPFTSDTEAVLYESAAPVASATGGGDTGDLLAEMGLWNFGLPFAEALPDGDVLVLYYRGTADVLEVCWARVAL
ncbi:MAG: sialidase family protein [Acidobacteriota bacterium]